MTATAATQTLSPADRFVIHEIEDGVFSLRDMQTHQWIADRDGREDFTNRVDCHDLRAEYLAAALADQATGTIAGTL